jgi:repressor LexA
MVEELQQLHPRRVEILRFLARREAAGEPPSTREIGTGVGLKSSQSVYQHLRRMESDGLVERRGRGARSIRLTERGWRVVGEIPLMGRIAAGRGMTAVADGEAYALAGELLLSSSGRQRYLLRVAGDSMVGAKISDGDLVVVEEEKDPPDGAIVVALLAGDEVTVKRLYRKNSHVLLVAESTDHEDIEVEWGEVEVQGRVVYVIHAAT